MNVEWLRELAVEGESERLEFKSTTGDLKGGLETLCGFLNGNGGKVLFGVSNSGRFRGQTVTDNTLREVAHEITKLDPPATITQTRVSVSNSADVLILETTLRASAPYVYNGRPYQRIGTTTSIMPQAEYERRLLNRGHAQRRWENQIAEGYSPSDLDETEIRRTIREAIDAGRLESIVTGPTEALDKLHLVQEGHPVQAAVVAFAKAVQPGYPQCSLRMARFRGVTKNEFVDQRQISKNAFRLLNEAMGFLNRHLPVRGRFTPGVLERQDEPLFPPLALREALVNALCHRDYSIVGGAVSVAVFDDRLEIISTGDLPFDVQIDDLKREHNSKPRNPLLADVFYRRGLIERWGRGTQNIVDLCVEAGHPEPEFEERAGEVVVRFLPSGYVPPHRVSHDLSERQRRVLHILSDGEKWKFGDIGRRFSPPPPKRTLGDDLVMLRNLGLIDSSGRGPGARWWLKSSEPERGGKGRKGAEKGGKGRKGAEQGGKGQNKAE